MCGSAHHSGTDGLVPRRPTSLGCLRPTTRSAGLSEPIGCACHIASIRAVSCGKLMNVRLLLLIAAIPVLAYGASWGVEAKLNSELRSALSQAPDAPGRDVPAVRSE